MTGDWDPPDPVLLYDVARGFLGLGSPETAHRHLLLSTMGACAAGEAVLLIRRDGGSLATAAARGAFSGIERNFRLPRRLEEALLTADGPIPRTRFRALGPAARELGDRFGAAIWTPLVRAGAVVGLLGVGRRLGNEPYGERELRLVAEIAGLAALAWPEAESAGGSRPRREGARADTAGELRRAHAPLRGIVGDGAATAALLRELIAVADVDLPVLLVGETGTGKDLAARAVHELGTRRHEPFEAINCAAIPRDLMASALFGHEQGSFTGAVSTVRGAFERAGKGTIFLDEIGDMPLESQVMLLRVIQERRFRRVGGEKDYPTHARIVSATNQDLSLAMEAGRFRPDLYYRIQMYVIALPPLRERRDEIPALVHHILGRQQDAGRGPLRVSPAFLQAVSRMDLPGNVRELEGLVLSAAVRATGSGTITPAHLPPPARGGRASVSSGNAAGKREGVPTYGDMEREYIRSVLQLTEGNKREAAALMGIPRTTLNARIRKLGLDSTG